MKTLLRTVLTALLTAHLVSSQAQVPVYNSYPSATATILLDFDGMLVSGTVWNFSGPFTANPSGLTNLQITEVFNRVAEDYRPFNINITTEEAKYTAAPAAMRMRVIITSSYEWYGSGAGGVAYVNSFKWGDGTPCFVFSSLFGYNVKNIAEAVSHEAGHTVGLRHQSTYDAACFKTSEYNWGQGTGEIGWAPIMGAGYNQNMTVWHNGPNSFGCASIQSDLDIVTSSYYGFGYRPDDNGNNFGSSTGLSFDGAGQFTINGVVERTTDIDYYQFTLPEFGNFTLDAIPYNVGTGNAGSDLDMNVVIYDQYYNALGTYNPGNQLSSLIDTILSAGTYYISVSGEGNMYATDYGSLGSYSLQAGFIDGTLLPIHHLRLNGNADQNLHNLEWVLDADEPISGLTLLYSTDGRQFKTLVNMSADKRAYSWFFNENKSIQYRLMATLESGRKEYSNTIILRSGSLKKPTLVGNQVRSSLSVNSPDVFAYQILDMNGRFVKEGQVQKGFSVLELRPGAAGIYLIRFSGNGQVWTEKFFRN